MIKIFATTLSLCLTLFVLGCAAGPAAQGPEPMRLGPDASGSVTRLKPGQSLDITLPSNPSTGFGWHVVKYDSEQLSLDEDDYVPPTEDTRVGQPGQHRFVFTAKKRGSSVLELAYYRPWEGTENAGDWFQTIVEIR